MDISKITDAISVSPQIRLDDIHELARLGFQSIISDRPDGEEHGQPTADTVGLAAEHAGLQFRHIPVIATDIGDRDIALFAAAMKDLPKPVLAFCRTGTRAAMLWALSQAAARGADAVLAATRSAGYDLEQLRPRLEREWPASADLKKDVA